MEHVASFRDIKHRSSLVLASLIIPTVIPFLTTAGGHIFFFFTGHFRTVTSRENKV